MARSGINTCGESPVPSAIPTSSPTGTGCQADTQQRRPALGQAVHADLVRERPMPSSEMVSRQMSRMPTASTGPELNVRRLLHRRGLRFRVHIKRLPGTPDIVFSKARLAIFIDGCFWHGCPEHGVFPKSNAEWWADKLAGNRERDQRKDSELELLGWLPVHFWEHESAEGIVDQIDLLWRRRTGRT